MKNPLSHIGFVTAIVALALLVDGCESVLPRKPENVVLISIDTVSPRRMSLYGAARKTTPAIDKLAAESVVFHNAYSTAPWTLPAHASMLSGMYPTSLSDDPNDKRLYRLAPLLSTLLRKNGYLTAAITENGFLSRQFGADTGFDYYREALKGAAAQPAVAWLKTSPRQPFFLLVHTYSAHIPYSDRRYVEGLDAGRIKDVYTKTAPLLHWNVCCGNMKLTDKELEFLMALYDGGVSAADAVVEALLSAIQDEGLAGNTAIIITSDHGQEFFEHTGRGAYHGHSLYDEVLRVPLVWYEPGGAVTPGNVSADVSLIDIVPTILARLGINDEIDRDGEDLSPLLENGGWSVERALFAEGTFHGPKRFSVWDYRAKLIRTPEPSVQFEEGVQFPMPLAAPVELYLRTDTREAFNIASNDSFESVRSGLADLLDRHLSKAPVAGSDLRQPRIDDDLNERLRELGYQQ